MNKNTILAVVFLAVLGVAGIYVWNQSNDSANTANNQSGDFMTQEGGSSASSFESDYTDATAPSDEDADQAERLWPHILKPQVPGLKEKVAEEWRSFSAKYPNNVYIPSMFKSRPMTKEEEREALETLDAVGSQEANLGAFIANNKYATGEPPAPKTEKDANPKEQARFFDYKIRELQSRIELIENYLQSGEADASQKAIAAEDLKSWKNELKKFQEVAKSVPNT